MVKVNDMVLIDEPQDEDSWSSGFTGIVLKIDKTFAIIQSFENNSLYCVDLTKILGVR